MLAFAVAFAAAIAPRLYGQVIRVSSTIAVQEGDATASDPKRAFVLPSQPAEVTEALEDFTRYSKHQAWERAFKALGKLAEAKPGGLLPAQGGFYVPVRTRVRQALAELPAEGKEAYRLFFDAEAKKLLEEAQGKEEIAKLGRVFAGYLFTSAGDAAAERLGDIYFEQGEMGKAAECWQAVVAHCPDSAIPRVRLLVKTAIALARGGRWREFQEMQRLVRERHAGETVVLGGKEVEAAAHLASLAEDGGGGGDKAADTGASMPFAGGGELPLPAGAEPLWQFRFYSAASAQAIANLGRQWGWGRLPVSQMVPPAAVDDARVYVNFLGHHVALDLETGKLVWRSGKFHDLAQKLAENYYVVPEQYRIAVREGRVWCLSRDARQLGQQGVSFGLSCVEAATGKVVWNSLSVGDLRSWNLAGTPLVSGEHVYAAGVKPPKTTELYVLRIRAKDGKLMWSTQVGTHQVDQGQMYYQRTAQPSLVLHRDKLYVDTHAGALIELNPGDGAVNWAFGYDSAVPNTEYWSNQEAGLLTEGVPLASGERLYFKGMRSDRLYALDLSGPALAWQRPVSPSAMLAAVDGERLYLLGEELTCLDTAAQKLAWATKVPVGTSWTRPVFTADRCYLFTSRGVFEVDKRSGDRVGVFRGADLDSLGGSMFVTPKALVTVSNLAVTAYPLGAAEAVSGK